MKQIRQSIFETNSSSTHSIGLVCDLNLEVIQISEPCSLKDCPVIELLDFDDFYPQHCASNIFGKLQILLTDGVMAHPNQREDCLKTFDELFEYIKQKDGIQLKYSLDKLNNKKFLKEWKEYSDGNGNPILNYPLYGEHHDQSLEQLYKQININDVKEIIEERSDTVEYFNYDTSQYSHVYRLKNEIDHLKLDLKFMKSGHKNFWELKNCRSIIDTIDYLYQFVIDDRFNLIIDRD